MSHKLAAAITEGKPFRKKAYLTIDDSPSSSFVDKMQYLQTHNIPAIFFCIGNLLEQRPAAIIDSIQRGFAIGNHSYSHPAFSKISLEQCKAEIVKTDKIIENLYQQAGVEWKTKWFRFPYGDKGDLKNGKVFSLWRRADQKRKRFIQNVLKDLGYSQPKFETIQYSYMKRAKLFEDIDWSWSFDIMEWALLEDKPTQGIKNLQKVFARLDQKRPRDCRGFLGFEKRWLASPSGELILLHDHEETTPHFNAIIDKLRTLPLQFEAV